MRIRVQIILVVLLMILCLKSTAETYYVNVNTGNDNMSGTVPKTAFRSLAKLSSLKLLSGDSIMLASGSIFRGMLELNNVHGNLLKPIVIASYQSDNVGKDQKSEIDANGYMNGILLENCSFIEIENIKITANGGLSQSDEKLKKQMRCGVLVKVSKSGNYNHIKLNGLQIEDVFFEDKGFRRGAKEVKTANGSQNYGWGIRFINNAEEAILEDIIIENCVVKSVSHTGIKLTGSKYGIRNIQIINNKVIETGGPGIQMSGVEYALVRNNHVNKSGSNNDSRKWGRGSGLWTWGSNHVLIEKNYFLNANGPGDSAGAHIDYNCKNIVLQYNFSANNAGGFCEILGNNYNCSYRYNISVNDGYRVKGENGAFQEGKIFWLSGYNGKRKRKGPFNSYFYNNTIYVKKGIQAKIAIDKAASGVLIANNIFCFEGKTSAVLGDQYNPEKEGIAQMKNVVFSNNLYLNKRNWPKQIPIKDDKAIYGRPNFARAGGDQMIDYLPANAKRIKNMGIEIDKIKGDTIGLTLGLKVNHDILGNEIIGAPDLGAIELK